MFKYQWPDVQLETKHEVGFSTLPKTDVTPLANIETTSKQGCIMDL